MSRDRRVRSAAPVVGALVELGDDGAGGLLEKARYHRMHESGPGRRKKPERESEGETRVFAVAFVYAGGVIEEKTGEHGDLRLNFHRIMPENPRVFLPIVR